jgi:anthranilate phosphoribosyltransferase
MVVAYILCVTEVGKEKEVQTVLKKFKEVKEAYIVYGEYDIVLKIEIDNLEDLDAFITKKLRSIGNVERSSTMIAL